MYHRGETTVVIFSSKGFRRGLVSLETRLFLIVVHIFYMISVAPESLDSKGLLENQNM